LSKSKRKEVQKREKLRKHPKLFVLNAKEKEKKLERKKNWKRMKGQR
jgi:hypothetical protein